MVMVGGYGGPSKKPALEIELCSFAVLLPTVQYRTTCIVANKLIEGIFERT